MNKPDWKQAMLNEAEATAEADAAWAAEAEAYAESAWVRRLLAFIVLALLSRFTVPVLSELGLHLTAPLVCASGAFSPCLPALLGVVLSVGLYAVFLGWQMGRRGLDIRWLFALNFIMGDALSPVAGAMGWGLVSWPDFLLYIAAFVLPYVPGYIYGEQYSAGLR